MAWTADSRTYGRASTWSEAALLVVAGPPLLPPMIRHVPSDSFGRLRQRLDPQHSDVRLDVAPCIL